MSWLCASDAEIQFEKGLSALRRFCVRCALIKLKMSQGIPLIGPQPPVALGAAVGVWLGGGKDAVFVGGGGGGSAGWLKVAVGGIVGSVVGSLAEAVGSGDPLCKPKLSATTGAVGVVS